MNKILKYPAVLSVFLALAACEKKETVTISIPTPTPIDLQRTPDTVTSTLETKKLGLAIDEFVAHPGEIEAANVKKAFADLDGEIAELQARVAETTGQDRAEAQGKLTNLQTYRAAETARFSVASVTVPASGAVPVAPVDTRSGAEKVEDNVEGAARRIGNSIENGVENVGDKIHDATH